MIPIRLLNGTILYINSDLVESVAAAPDTVITLTSGRKIVASSAPDEIIEAVVAFRRRVRDAPAIGAPGPVLDPAIRRPADRAPAAT